MVLKVRGARTACAGPLRGREPAAERDDRVGHRDLRNRGATACRGAWARVTIDQFRDVNVVGRCHVSLLTNLET